ncbi:hypothetical protein ACFV42_23460 [Streptomyces solisilvae]|uniref:hypothetical protein n=1 Tax=Streptomyces malaysiensis TaxID=92644 RepID=UPI0036C54539
MSDHIKNMEASAERRREEREKRKRDRERRKEQRTGTDVETLPPDGTPETARPQPFTPDLIPDPVSIEATGDLSADEIEDLRQCERAFAHADQAEWMRGKAAHAVRERRLYRPRTWPEYCEEVLGESESEVNRMILEWPLGEKIAQFWVTPRPTPSSHKRALLPLIDTYGLEATARGYVLLRMWAAEHKERVTASVLTAMVNQQQQITDGPSDEPLPVAQFLERKTRALEQRRTVPTQSTTPDRIEASPSPQPQTSALPPGAAAAPASPAATTPSDTTPAEPPHNEQEGQPDPGTAKPDAEAPPAESTEVIDAEIVYENLTATTVRQTMQGVREGISEKLRGADPDVLKAIITLGDEITSAAKKELESE